MFGEKKYILTGLGFAEAGDMAILDNSQRLRVKLEDGKKISVYPPVSEEQWSEESLEILKTVCELNNASCIDRDLKRRSKEVAFRAKLDSVEGLDNFRIYCRVNNIPFDEDKVYAAMKVAKEKEDRKAAAAKEAHKEDEEQEI